MARGGVWRGEHYSRGNRITMEILAHSVRWSEMCDRWLSYKRDRERFAPDMTPAVPLGATVDRSGAF